MIMLLGLLALTLGTTLVMLILWIVKPLGGRAGQPHRWAGTAAGLALCAAVVQFASASAMKSPAGPGHPGAPTGHGGIAPASGGHPLPSGVQTLDNMIFADPTLAILLVFWAGVCLILSFWIE